VISPTEKILWHRCESLVYQVFLESGYVEESPTGRVPDFDQYASMEFLAAFVGDRQLPLEQRIPSGVVRLVYAPQAREMGPGLFPTIDHADELEIPTESLKKVLAVDPGQCFDMATMAIPRENRDGKALKALITAIAIRVWEQPRLRYGFAAIDTTFYRKLKERRLPFVDLGPSAMYRGSLSTATMIDSLRVPRRLQKLFIPLLGFRECRHSVISRGSDL
jgi:hypothetical protein